MARKSFTYRRSGTIIINGKPRKIYEGEYGGWFYIKKGKKVYTAYIQK